MLLPENINPEYSVYYNGAIVLKELQKKNGQRILDLYQNIKSQHQISFSTFVLCLDWLYLINVAQLNKDGIIYYVSQKINNN